MDVQPAGVTVFREAVEQVLAVRLETHDACPIDRADAGQPFLWRGRADLGPDEHRGLLQDRFVERMAFGHASLEVQGVRHFSRVTLQAGGDVTGVLVLWETKL